MLKVNIQSVPNGVKLLCAGRIVLGVEAETLRCIATARAEPYLMLDLRGVHVIDAAGLGLLAELHCWARQHNKLLTIANPSRRVCQLLSLTALLWALQISSSTIAEAAIPDQEDEKAQPAMTA